MEGFNAYLWIAILLPVASQITVYASFTASISSALSLLAVLPNFYMRNTPSCVWSVHVDRWVLQSLFDSSLSEANILLF